MFKWLVCVPSRLTTGPVAERAQDTIAQDDVLWDGIKGNPTPPNLVSQRHFREQNSATVRFASVPAARFKENREARNAKAPEAGLEVQPALDSFGGGVNSCAFPSESGVSEVNQVACWSSLRRVTQLGPLCGVFQRAALHVKAAC